LEGVTGGVTLHPIMDSANDERTRFIAVLEIPPVVSARNRRAGSNRQRREGE
jgi:hypothetical protein